MMRKIGLTGYIVLALITGLLTGYFINKYATGQVIAYTPKDYGKDVVHFMTDGKDYAQPVYVLKNIKDQDTIKSQDLAGAVVVIGLEKTKITPAIFKQYPKHHLQKIKKSDAGAAISNSNLTSFAEYAKLLSTIFIRLVQMIIAPLIFSTLVVGIAKLGDLKTVGRVGGKAMLWFISASLTSLVIGLILVNILKPGVGIDLSLADTSAAKDLIGKKTEFSLTTFVEHMIPKSIFEALSSNEILQIVIFSIFCGAACASLGEYSKPVVKALEIFSHVILRIVNYVMNFAPLGVFGAICAVVAVKGLGIFNFYIHYFIAFIIGIIVLWIVLIAAGYLLLGRNRMKRLMPRLTQPVLIAFSTTSSEAVFPKLTEELENYGCDEKIVSFTLPLGYSFNLDGSMMYMTFSSIAIAQAYGVHLSWGQMISMLLILMLTSKGVAGVPRASLIVVLATCAMFKIPVEGIALILPIDHFCDMFRSATNVVGNSLSTVVVSKWEGALTEE